MRFRATRVRFRGKPHYNAPVGKLEERVFESLVALRRADPDLERHMLVFPISLMTASAILGSGSFAGGDVVRVVREGDALMLCRPQDP